MDNASSFYITLPSSASLKLYPNNKVACFTTHLDRVFDFNENEYEVGLTEISFNTFVENISENDACFSLSTIDRTINKEKNTASKNKLNLTTYTIHRKKIQSHGSSHFHDRIAWPGVGRLLSQLEKGLSEDVVLSEIKPSGNISFFDKFGASVYDDEAYKQWLSGIQDLSHDSTEYDVLSDPAFMNYLTTLRPSRTQAQAVESYLESNFKPILKSLENKYTNSSNKLANYRVVSELKEISIPGTNLVEHFSFAPGRYPKLKDLINEMNNVLKHSTFYKGIQFFFLLKDNKLKITTNTASAKEDIILSLTNTLKKAFGLKQQHVLISDLEKQVFDPHLHALDGGFCYIYTDVIENSFIGDTRAPLLRSLLLPVSATQSQASINFVPTHYVRVARGHVSTISVSLRTVEGELTPFEEGGVELKLHFKKVKTVE